MSAPQEPAQSLLAKYATREALTYYGLVFPAILAEVVFTLSIASTPGALVPQNSAYGSAALTIAQLLPLALLAVSAYAVFAFRPSILVALLIASFFLAISVSNGIFFLGAQLDLGDTVVAVVAATFLALAGFNYARGLKLLAGRRPDITSSGPLGYNVLGIALETGVPLAAAVVLVLLVEQIVAALGVQAALLPSPLSTLTTLYLQTRIGLVFTTLFVAGAAIWVMRQFIEPVILHFTLSPADARKELLSEIEPTTKSVRKVVRYRPSGGFVWGLLTVTYCFGILAALAIFLPRGEFTHDLLATLNLQAPSPSPAELLLQNSIQNAILRANILFAQSQDFIRTTIRLLWG